VCILLQDGGSAGLVWQAEVDGKVKPAAEHSRAQQSTAEHSAAQHRSNVPRAHSLLLSS
jgi:hypothetical protein